jgi:hypothetical protein
MKHPLRNHIDGVMVTMLTLVWLLLGSSPGQILPKTIKLVFAANPKLKEVGTKTGWPGIKIMCPSEAKFLPVSVC